MRHPGPDPAAIIASRGRTPAARPMVQDALFTEDEARQPAKCGRTSPPHMPLPDGACTCGAAGWLALLTCGCWSWAHGRPPVGGYVTCGASLAHQTSYRVLEVREGPP